MAKKKKKPAPAPRRPTPARRQNSASLTSALGTIAGGLGGALAAGMLARSRIVTPPTAALIATGVGATAAALASDGSFLRAGGIGMGAMGAGQLAFAWLAAAEKQSAERTAERKELGAGETKRNALPPGIDQAFDRARLDLLRDNAEEDEDADRVIIVDAA